MKRSPFADPVDLMADDLEKIRATALAPTGGLTDAQHAARAEGVGASESWDAIFNPATLWLKKTGREPREDDDALSRLGQMIEPYILGECQRARGLKDMHKPDTMRRGRMVAHLDSTALMASPIAQKVAVEGKWRGSRDGFGEAGTADVPQKILFQVTSQCRVAGLTWALVPVLFLRPPVVVYDVPYDVELGDMIEEGVNRFWWHVEHDKAPDVNPDAPEAVAILRKLYPGTNGERVHATLELDPWRKVYEDSQALHKDYSDAANVAKAHLLRAMGEAAELQFADGKVFRRKLVKRAAYAVEASQYIDGRFVTPKD